MEVDREEYEALVRDANRYRWLRDPFGHGAPWLVVKRYNDQATMGGAFLDAAIDAAMEQT
jgi:hypothetical protein